jgi:hypothetical protein
MEYHWLGCLLEECVTVVSSLTSAEGQKSHALLRLVPAVHNNVLMCGILYSVITFGDSEDGCKQRILHLANDYQLPIFMDKTQEFIKYI